MQSWKDIPLNKYQILVTGGAGFIGSNLCEYLVSKNATVVCMDNLSTGAIKNIDHLMPDDRFTFIKGDIRNFSECQQAVNDCDFVLHQAALGSVPRSIKDPLTTNEVNVSGFLNMLYAAKEAKVARFVYAASSSTYGDSEQLPKIEDTIGKPLSPYAVTKLVNELYASVFNQVYGIDTIGLRYFNVFGKRQDPDSTYAAVIPLFIRQFLNHQSPTINGDGSFSRDFTPVDNVIQMNILAMLTTNKAAYNQIYNTACGARTTLNELVAIIKEALHPFDKTVSKIDPIYGAPRLGDVPHSLASIDKGSNLLGYTPEYSLETGMQKAIKWYWEHLK